MSQNLVAAAHAARAALGRATLRALTLSAAMGALLAAPVQAAPNASAPGAPTAPTATSVPQVPRDTLEACFVYVSPVGQAGWSFQHEQGRQAMQQALGSRVTSRFVESVAEGPDSERVMREMARSGCGLVVATSFGYLEPALRVAAEYPQVAFEHAGGWKRAPNLGTYDARHYESRWLAGYLAGLASKKGVAGYVAGFAVPEVVQGVNAFALGMRAANPAAQVRVVWLDAWFDPPRERDAAVALIAQGADVLTHHTASGAVAQAAEAAKVAFIAYHGDQRVYAPTMQLAAASHHWGAFYTRTAQALLEGRWKPQAMWGGMREGMVGLDAMRPDLPAEWRRALAREAEAIRSGKRVPFAAPIVDRQGRLRAASGALDDRAIASMDWLVQGVQGGLPGGR